MSDIRIIKGSTGGREGSSFTVPTAPLTATSDTVLLISGTDASIIDKAQASNFTIVDGAVASSGQQHFSENTVYFDGTNDHVLLPADLITGNGPLSLSFVFSADSNSFDADEKMFSELAICMHTELRWIACATL